MGKPSAAEIDNYEHQTVDGIEVYFPSNLEMKQGETQITIRLKGFLWSRWLELEGARAKACYTYKEELAQTTPQ